MDPPARVASLSQIEGSVVFAPAGETEWVDAVLNRPITRGDRLWTDRGARAELHLGSAVLHLDDQTFLDVTDLDDDVLQASLNEGTVNARVRELARGENFEIDTPQLAFRASRPGDYRIDVDPARGTTRVTVRRRLGAGVRRQRPGAGAPGRPGRSPSRARTSIASACRRRCRRTASTAGPPTATARRTNRSPRATCRARWSATSSWTRTAVGRRTRATARSGIPRVTVADWAPYRYGHWEFIAPWGWTWIDDAPWGFAPFHYGRWAMIGSRWAWVPGRIGPRPVYAPALVVFVGGSGGVSLSLSFGSGSGIGWFPLAPGEAWRPYYRTSPRYVTSVNRYIVGNNQVTNNHFYINQRHPSAVTAVRVEDFSGGRPVYRNRRQVDATELDRVRIATQPTLPEPRRIVESRPSRTRALPPPTLSAAPVPLQPRAGSPGPGPAMRRREVDQRPIAVPRPQVQEHAAGCSVNRNRGRGATSSVPLVQEPRREQPRDARQQERQDEQQRREAGREQERAASATQQLQMQRQQDEQRRQQQVQREQQVQAQRDHALRQQQQAQERAQRQQQAAQEQAMRQQQQAQEQALRQQQAQERAQRQQQAAQEQLLRQQQQQQQRQEQQRALRQQPQPQPQVAPPPEAQPAPRERGRGRPEREQREDNRSQGGDEGGRGRGQGRGG